MKPGVRALGVAESFRGAYSTVGGAVVRASRVADGFSVGSCTVGGLDATDVICELYDSLDREDVRYVLISGIAPAWFNILDLAKIHDHVDRPVLAVTYEESPGLENTIRAEFDGEERQRRLNRYRALPERHGISINDQRRFIRPVGCSLKEGKKVLDGFTPQGGRPEPIRIARLLARALDAFRHRQNPET